MIDIYSQFQRWFMGVQDINYVKIVIIIPSAAIFCIRPSPLEKHSNLANVSYYCFAVIQGQISCTHKKNKLFSLNVFKYNRFNASRDRKAINQSGPQKFCPYHDVMKPRVTVRCLKTHASATFKSRIFVSDICGSWDPVQLIEHRKSLNVNSSLNGVS